MFKNEGKYEVVNQEADSSSAFHPDNLPAVMVIQLNRIYDLLMLIAHSQDKESADALVELHSMGGWLTPPIAYRPESFGETDEQSE